MSSVRERRIANEWNLLAELARQNAGPLEVHGRGRKAGSDYFEVTLHQTGALVGTPPDVSIANSHPALFRFAEYFPAVPIEVFLTTPVFHANVHPENGFVCLWSGGSAGDTIATAILRLQAVISWRLVNTEADHLLNPLALHWSPTCELPLPCTMVRLDEATQLESTYRKRTRPSRTRLSDA